MNAQPLMAAQQEPGEAAQPEHRHGQRSLRQDAQRREQIHERQVAGLLRPFRPGQEAVEGRRRTQHREHVRAAHGALDEERRQRGERARDREPRRIAGEPPGHPGAHRDQGEPRERRGQPHGELVEAEDGARCRQKPVGERRVRGERDAADAGREPVAPRHHLARHLGDLPLVDARQRSAGQNRQEQRGVEDQDQGQAAPKRGRLVHGSRMILLRAPLTGNEDFGVPEAIRLGFSKLTWGIPLRDDAGHPWTPLTGAIRYYRTVPAGP